MTKMAMEGTPPRRLVADDFVALRSLARSGRWQQGEQISWRFGRREWRSVSYSECAALDAADRLVAMGLVEDTFCRCGCGRAIFQLTQRGNAFSERLDAAARARSNLEPAVQPVRVPVPVDGGWFERLVRRAFEQCRRFLGHQVRV